MLFVCLSLRWMCYHPDHLERYTLEDWAPLVSRTEEPDATSFSSTYVPVQIDVLIVMIVTRTIGRQHHHNLASSLHTICVANFSRVPAAREGVCGCKKDKPVQAPESILNSVRSFGIWFGGHRRVLTVHVEYPALCLERLLEAPMVVREEGRPLPS